MNERRRRNDSILGVDAFSTLLHTFLPPLTDARVQLPRNRPPLGLVSSPLQEQLEEVFIDLLNLSLLLRNTGG